MEITLKIDDKIIDILINKNAIVIKTEAEKEQIIKNIIYENLYNMAHDDN